MSVQWIQKWTAGVLLLIGMGILPAVGQDIAFRVHPEIIRIGEAATAEFTIYGNLSIGQPQLPPVDGLQITGTGQSFKDLNGQRSLTYSYRLVPLKPGDYTLGPFTLQVGNTEFGVPKAKLKVLPPGGSGQGAQQEDVDWNALVFATMETKNPEVFNQQFLDVEFSIYHKNHLRLDSQVQPMNLPSSGLAIKELKELSRTREDVNGDLYEVRRFLVKFQAITEGTFVLKPTLRTYILVDKPRRRRGSLFDDVFGSFSRYEKHPIDLTPDPLELRVAPIPEEGRPENFQGAVGEFAMDIKLTPQNLKAGDPVTVRTIISGQGNMDTLTAPELTLGDDFRMYEPKLITKELNSAGSSGRKVFEQVIIPRQSGDVELPPLTFSYFNPNVKSFVELKKEGLTLHIAENAQANGSVVVHGGQPSPETRNLEVVDLDIAYLKPLPRNWEAARLGQPSVLQRPWVFALSPLMLATTFFLTRKRRQREGNVLLQRREAAPKKARAAIQRAQQALAEKNPDAYYEALHQAVSDFYSDRFGWGAGEFDPARVCQHLEQQQAPAEDIDVLRNVLNHAEALRYGAGLSETAKQEAGQAQLDRLSAILKRSERS